MAWEIIKQPDGKFCIFSTIVDHLVHFDLDDDQVIGIYEDEWQRNGYEFATHIINELNNGHKPYRRTHSFEEIMSWIKEVHGKFEIGIQDGVAITESHFYK